MPRLPRIHLENTLYYINMEGPAQEPIFRDDEDRSRYLDILAQAKKEFSFKLFAYSLLPESLQLLVEPGSEFPVSQVMQKVTPNYTKYYNAKYARKGHLFAKRFRSVFVEKEHYLGRLTRFVHYLPVRAGLVSAPRDFAFSSYRTYVSSAVPASIDMGAEVAEVMNSLPGLMPENPFERFSLSVPEQELALFEKKLGRGSFLGSAEFIARIKREMAEHLAERESEPAVVPVSEKNPSAALGVHARGAFLFGALIVTLGLSVFSYQMSHYVAPVPANPPAAVAAKKTTDEPVTETAKTRDPMIAKAIPMQMGFPTNGTIWNIQLYTVSPEGVMTPIKDEIRFEGRSFNSHYFSTKGFYPSNYTVRVQKNGTITWETIQKNSKGEMATWRGDFQDGRMEGVMSYQPESQRSQDFSFMSNTANSKMVKHG